MEASIDVENEQLDSSIAQLQIAAVNILKEHDQTIEEKIVELKAKYGPVFLYIFSGNEYFIMRQIKRFEFKQIKADPACQDDLSTEDALVKKCVVYPEIKSIDMMPAGQIRVLAELILYYSYFGSDKPVIEL